MKQQKFNLKRFIERTWSLNRKPIGPDTTKTAEIIQELGGGDIHYFESGEEVLTWVIPDEWVVEKGVLYSPEGEIIADYHENPLYLCSYSAPYEGTVSLNELQSHLFTMETVPDAIYFHDRWQYEYGEKRKWGFSIPHNKMKALSDGKYEVIIKSYFKKGNMPLNDIFIPGKSEETILICAHTCHPRLVSDGIACVGLAVQLIEFLRKKTRRYSYRFIFGPEYFSAAAYLSRFSSENFKGGFFLDILSVDSPLAFSSSFSGTSLVDKATRNSFLSLLNDFKEFPYRRLYGNDEMFYDGPGYGIPMVCIGRIKDAKYYHTHYDNLKNCNFNKLQGAYDILVKIVDSIENDIVIKRNYTGPLYLSRYLPDFYFNPQNNRNMYDTIQAIQILLDGKNSYLEIAEELGVDFAYVKDFCDCLLHLSLAKQVNGYQRTI